MYIAINGNEANVEKPVGSNVYALEILRALEKLDRKNNYQILLKTQPVNTLPKERAGWSYRVFGPSLLWTQFALSLYTFRQKPDLLFSPGHYGAFFSACPQIVSIMDLAYLKYPEEFRPRDLWQLKQWTERSVNSAQKIVAISKHTKQDLIGLYRLKEEKIEVVYPGVSLESRSENQELRCKDLLVKFQIQNSKFLLFIGTLQPRKNIVRLVSGFKQIQSKYPSIKLVIVGKKGWLYEDIFKIVKQQDLDKGVVFTGFVTDQEKYDLLRRAEMLVFPSLYEGFGFPILEAFQVGCPVVSSHNSSLPDVAGNAALFIENEKQPASIAQTVLSMLELPKKEKDQLIMEGKKQLAKFSWEKTGRRIIELFKNIETKT